MANTSKPTRKSSTSVIGRYGQHQLDSHERTTVHGLFATPDNRRTTIIGLRLPHPTCSALSARSNTRPNPPPGFSPVDLLHLPSSSRCIRPIHSPPPEYCATRAREYVPALCGCGPCASVGIDESWSSLSSCTARASYLPVTIERYPSRTKACTASILNQAYSNGERLNVTDTISAAECEWRGVYEERLGKCLQWCRTWPRIRRSTSEGIATRPLAALTASATALGTQSMQRGELGSVGVTERKSVELNSRTMSSDERSIPFKRPPT
ncbi:hypothetical protein BJ912DRAFT_1062416 [Pholiota molesta]|nr:hypothetical protein BJ912DRAFT_1062416 [Pholiota molesta]